MEDLTKPRLDPDRCTGCGLCLSVCPSDVLTLADGTISLAREGCFGCDHCAAVCPAEAIRIDTVSPGNLSLATIETGGCWLPFGEFDTALLVRLLYSRRSCRCFTDAPVERSALEDLARIGTMAPSGTNSQRWSFTIVPDRAALLAFGRRIGGFYGRLNRLAANPAARLFSRLFMQDKLGHYYRRYYNQVEEALRQFHETGRDRLFHGATAAILIGTEPGATCPREDAMLAAQNIALAAHTMGIGTCLIGFAVEAMRRDRSIQRSLGIPETEDVHAVIALGQPAVAYLRPAGRKPAKVRYATSTKST
ncbi:MAG TPA: nitroreductase family protein [Syntrophales bacterium]|nr:nitroreductase family protein [Syntrophales bacterium]